MNNNKKANIEYLVEVNPTEIVVGPSSNSSSG